MKLSELMQGYKPDAKFEGWVTNDDRDIDDYFGLETLKLIVRQPLALTGTSEKFDIVCRVNGGGVTGQAGAMLPTCIFCGQQKGQFQVTGRICSSSDLDLCIQRTDC